MKTTPFTFAAVAAANSMTRDLQGETCEDYPGAEDSFGDGCDYYDLYPDNCGYYDDDWFVAGDACCGCGGGFSWSDTSLGGDGSGRWRNYDYAVTQCTNTDNGEVDTNGQGCNSPWPCNYNYMPSIWCGFYDSETFDSATMCCACGGGDIYSEAPINYDPYATGCYNTDFDYYGNQTTDSNGYGCETGYDGTNEYYCNVTTYYNDSDFYAEYYCCSCGGGTWNTYYEDGEGLDAAIWDMGYWYEEYTHSGVEDSTSTVMAYTRDYTAYNDIWAQPGEVVVVWTEWLGAFEAYISGDIRRLPDSYYPEDFPELLYLLGTVDAYGYEDEYDSYGDDCDFDCLSGDEWPTGNPAGFERDWYYQGTAVYVSHNAMDGDSATFTINAYGTEDSEGTCYDSNGDHLNYYGYECTYEGYTGYGNEDDWCGSSFYDYGAFESNTMCCACGGGSTAYDFDDATPYVLTVCWKRKRSYTTPVWQEYVTTFCSAAPTEFTAAVICLYHL